jgi:hypothetical protein
VIENCCFQGYIQTEKKLNQFQTRRQNAKQKKIQTQTKQLSMPKSILVLWSSALIGSCACGRMHFVHANMNFFVLQQTSTQFSIYSLKMKSVYSTPGQCFHFVIFQKLLFIFVNFRYYLLRLVNFCCRVFCCFLPLSLAEQ